ncbi:spore germination protein [Ruminiclostridium sufflavum DSM 19573]|uniref:Spore germination protein n=1 Tax=Ruminiclostridium sufflavum DSM 19573 TaxID=1121337 RepID=A0A318XHB3_9FIRM|nr:LysM peptidoglycan-binding domain-containing protein [Ruminiclostridium sufflavum]PYG84359.1 spore germination protein [Ruminiclostridium sufflavum DSM 19573]
MRIHVVKPGESIYTIAQQYRVSPQKIISDNELSNPNQLVIGQTIVILEGTRRHTVEPGETLYSIARDYRIPVEELIKANPEITNPSMIYAGQNIIIPPMTMSFGTIEVNGYAFPNINMEVLRKTLPYLTYLSIFSYQVKPDGSLTSIEDTPLISAARAAGAAPIMVITNIKEGGSFDSDLAHTILNDTEVQNKLIDNVTKTLKAKGYRGLDIDFEYIYADDREKYNDFLRKIVSVLRPLGYTIATAVAPKISADQPGVLYQGHDYPVHGALVDHVIIMTYEWGFTYGPPMAVAPLNQVRRVINYAVTAIPRQKILMGIPNYGYDWTLPYEKGTAARALSNPGAVELAYEVGANIQYDPIAQSPFFRYYKSGRQHEVWFEDARSILAKLKLVNEYKLGGVSYWTIGRYFPQNWLVLNSVYNIKKV